MVKKKDYTRREIIGTFAAAAVAPTVLGGLPKEVDAEEAAQTKTWQVDRYSLGWDTRTGVGRIVLYLKNPTPSNPALDPNPSRRRIVVNSLSEIPGYMALLKESPVFFNSDGWLHIGEEIGN